jgi:sirohydrochlorin ferrochelatase
MKGILLVDHGSRKREANEMLGDVEKLVQTMAGSDVIVRHAHMELAEPTIAQGIASCIEAGAREVIVFPYMLSPGKHSTSDIPRMVGEVARNHPGIAFSVTSPFGIDEKLGQVILARAGISAGPKIPVTAT